jgi:hypothetical protein
VKPVWFTFSAAGDGKPLLIEENSALVGVACAGLCLVSTDPSATMANTIQTPATTGQVESVIYAAGLNASMFSQLRFELNKGDIIYLSRTAAGGIMLYFEVESELIPQLSSI